MGEPVRRGVRAAPARDDLTIQPPRARPRNPVEEPGRPATTSHPRTPLPQTPARPPQRNSRGGSRLSKSSWSIGVETKAGVGNDAIARCRPQGAMRCVRTSIEHNTPFTPATPINQRSQRPTLLGLYARQPRARITCTRNPLEARTPSVLPAKHLSTGPEYTQLAGQWQWTKRSGPDLP